MYARLEVVGSEREEQTVVAVAAALRAALRRLRDEGEPLLASATWLDSQGALESRVRYFLDLAAAGGGDVAGSRVLDAGCGSGIALAVYALAGAAGADGLELDPERLRAVDALRESLDPDVGARIAAEAGDVATMPYPDATFDLVLSHEAVGTYLEPDAFCREAVRVLRPGGTVVIAELNNVLNPLHRRQTFAVWTAYERGPAGTEVHGHAITDPFLAQRERAIGRAFPALDAQRVRRLAAGTFGMTEPQLLAACRLHLEDGGPPPSSYWRRGRRPVDPAGLVPEGRINPYALARRLAREGLRVRVRGYWAGADGRPAVRAANRALASAGPLTIVGAPQFRVIAQKR